MKFTFSIPTLVKASQGWFVRYHIDGREKREKLGLNRIQDLAEREKAFEELAAELHKKLKQGWNPFAEDCAQIFALSNMTIIDALKHALEQKKSKSEKTYSGYKSAVKFITAAIKSLALQKMMIQDVKKMHVKLILKEAERKNNWSDHAYNKYLIFFKGLCTALVDDDILDVNPVHGIKGREVPESTLHRPPTKDEFSKIVAALLEYPDFSRFCQTIYYTLAREAEILRLKVSMVDMKMRRIYFPAPITKGRKRGRMVRMNEFVYEYFRDMKLDEALPDDFVFGTFKNPRKVSKGERWYVPAPFPIHSNRPTELWKLLIKDRLGIDVTLYANKSAGADMMFEEGATVTMVSRIMGHQSEEITERHYMTGVDNKIKEDALKFVRKYGT